MDNSLEKEKLEVVPMAQEHIPALAALERECFSSPWSENALIEELNNPRAVFYVARIGGQVAGYAGMQHVLDEGDICNVAVFPQYRRRGIAREILLCLFRYAASNGISQIMLEVRAGNLGAQALYAGLGFEPVGRRKNFYTAPTEDALLLRKVF